MRISRGRLCALFSALTIFGGAGASAAQALSVQANGEFAHEPIMVVEPAQWLLGFQEGEAQLQTRRAAPQAAAARVASELRFSGLDAGQSAGLARSTFPQLVARRAGGLPPAPRGGRLGQIVSDHAVSLVLPGGKHGAIESFEPISVKTASGLVPIDLSLRETKGGFAPKTPVIGLGLEIPKTLSNGPALRDAGVSLVPVDNHGVPLASAGGTIDGATVFYGDSERVSAGAVDMDTLVKPETLGFDEETILRSERSPARLSYRIGMPRGARLIQRRRNGGIEIEYGGRVLATVSAPEATDAEGTAIPLSVHVSGDILTLGLQRGLGQYRFPIAVDPSVNDGQLNVSGSAQTNWHFVTNEGWYGKENAGGAGWTEYIPGSHSAAGYGAFTYQTQGVSSITSGSISGYWNDTGTHTTNELVIFGTNGTEGKQHLPESYGYTTTGTSVGSCEFGESCAPAAANNTFQWLQVSNNVGTGSVGENVLQKASVEISQTTGPTLQFDTTDPTVGGVPNALYGPNWLGHGTAIMFTAEDPGTGIASTEVLYKSEYLSNKRMGTEGLCAGLQCPPKLTEFINYSSALSDGSDKLSVWAGDAVRLYAGTTERVVKVDSKAPNWIEFKGLPSNHQIDWKPYTLKVEASDSAEAPASESAGIASFGLYVDGRKLGSPSGSCSPGPCRTLSGQWTINGAEFSAGPHVLEAVVTDYAGNVGVESTTIYVPAAHPIALGPGEVAPSAGEFSLSATDVSEGEGLSVTRAYGSRDLEAGVDGPLGSQWSIGLGSAEGLEVAPNGTVELNTGSGQKTTFSKSGSSYIAPPGDSNLSLSFHEAGSAKEYILANSAKGTSTKFTLPGGGGSLWVPTIQEGQLPSETTTYSYETVEVAGHKVTRPVEALAPEPAGVSCKPTLVAGCRALTFNYATSTTATGEGSSEWGDYSGNLTRVYLTYYQPVSKTMATTAIAQYSYDAKGRLRAEWDPRVSPALKTEYGYDSEGHVTALTSPGEETWGFVYGTTAGDTSAGRILKVRQAPKGRALWSGLAESNSYAPEIGGTPLVGSRLVAYNGSWSEVPVIYGYQWEDCNSAGAECKPIAGATNPNYTPVGTDTTHTLVVQVSATNGDGSVVASSAPSAPVAGGLGVVSKSLESSELTSVSCVPATADCVVSDASGNAYYSTNVSTTAAATWTAWSGPGTNPSEAIDCPSTSLCLLADGKSPANGGLGYSATSFGGAWTKKIEAINGFLSISCPNTSFCEAGGTAAWARWTSEPTGAWSGERQGPPYVEDEMSGTSCLSSSFCVIVTNKGEAYVANTTTIVKSNKWVRSDVDGTTPLKGVACVTTASCLAVDTAGNILKLAISSEGTATATTNKVDASNAMTAIACTASATCVAVDNQGNVFASITNGETWNNTKKMGDSLTAVSCATESLCVATDATGVAQAFNPGAEIPTEPVDPGNSLNVISCRAGTTTCVATDSKGKEFYATNVTGSSRATWHSWNGPSSSPAQAVECTESSTCLLAVSGSLYYSTSLGGTWTEAVTPVYGIDAVSCGSASFCVAAQSNGFFRYSKNPASNSWTAPGKMGSATMKTVSCLPNGTQQFCAIGDSSGNVHIATTTAQAESSSWRETNVDSASIESISCVSANRCTAVDSAGNALKMTISKEGIPTVKVINFDGTNPVASIACTISSTCIAVDSKGNVFTATGWGGTWSLSKTLPSGLTSVSCESSEHCFGTDTAGNVQVLYGTKVAEGEIVSPQPGTTVEYGVPVSGTGAPYSMTTGELAKWSQSDTPTQAVAIFPADEPMGWPASDYRRASVYYFDERQHNVNTATPAGGIATVEYNEQNDVTRELSADNRAAALAEVSNSAAASLKLDTEDTYSSDGAELLSTLGPQHTVKLSSGEETLARRHMVYSYDEGAPEGGPYRLVTKTTEGAQLEVGGEQDVRTTTNSYSGQSNLGWKLRAPTSVTTDPSGLKLTKTFVYDSSTGNVTETRNPGSAGEKDPHDTVMVYYTTAANSKYPECGSHPEWANLLCETTPGAQPGTSGLPELPTTVTTYNNWLTPSTVTKTSKGISRKWTYAFDEADRLTEATFSSTQGTSLPAVKYAYESSTGLLSTATTTVAGATKTLTRAHNTLGQLTSYTDADGIASTYEYDVDGRNTSINDGKGSDSYTYSSTSGLEAELTDAAVGKVSATYDVEGNLLTETAPDGITTKWVYNSAGEAVEVNDTKVSSCGTSCTWFSQSEVPSIHGQTASQTGTLAQGKYAYDQAGRLTEAAETPAGQGCTTRVYGYDPEGDMTGLTTRAPGAEGKCASSGGTVESHTYDAGDRLTGSSIKYDEFGDTTAMPAVDAGGSELLAGYYVDGQLASATQAGQTIGYGLDPSLRTREVVDTGTKSSTTVEHYASGSDSPSWTVDLAGNWTRNITGIGGELIATQTNGEAPTMQLSNLEGDVVATASSSSTSTALLSTVRNTEFGTPTTATPPKYSWLGAAQRPTELPSGFIAMGARGYVPQIGRFLQPDPRHGGSDNPYGYANDDPLNESDLSGEYVESGYVAGFDEEEKERAIERRIAEEEAAREEAERKAEEAAEAAAEAYAGGGGGGKGKKGKAGKVSPAIAMMHDSGGYKGKACKGKGPYRCAEPGTGNKPIKEGKKGGGKAAREVVGGAIEKAAEEHQEKAAEREAQEQWEECYYHEAC